MFRPTIKKEIRKHRISLLLHSTHLYRNLPLILADGRIHTARELIDRYGPEHASRLLHDPRRYEQFTVGLDYINASLTVPNAELLYHRSGREWQSQWVHLALDTSLLSYSDTGFSPVSAAAGRGKFIASGVDGFRALFVDPVESFSRRDLRVDEPTHPQAEILLKGSLDISVISSIHVPHRDAQFEVARLCEQNARTIPIEISPQLFVWPARLIPSVS